MNLERKILLLFYINFLKLIQALLTIEYIFNLSSRLVFQTYLIEYIERFDLANVFAIREGEIIFAFTNHERNFKILKVFILFFIFLIISIYDCFPYLKQRNCRVFSQEYLFLFLHLNLESIYILFIDVLCTLILWATIIVFFSRWSVSLLIIYLIL